MFLSVLIPTFNPAMEPLTRVLAALRAQTLPLTEWELIVVDNASRELLEPRLDLSWHPAGRVIREDRSGLTLARLAGFAEARGAIAILVDDDNVLEPDYLAQVRTIAAEHPKLGAWSGSVILEFAPDAVPPPAAWRSHLTERHVLHDAISTDRHDHDSTPWGAGLCVRREVFTAYARELAHNPLRRQLDLQGQTLLYGGDTDIAYVGCAHGYTKGVFARLTLQHLIPAQRCKPAYLKKSMEGHAYSSVFHGFILDGSVPTYLTSPVWRIKAWLRRLMMKRVDRIQAACHARGATRAVHDIRRLQATSS